MLPFNLSYKTGYNDVSLYDLIIDSDLRLEIFKLKDQALKMEHTEKIMTSQKSSGCMIEVAPKAHCKQTNNMRGFF